MKIHEKLTAAQTTLEFKTPWHVMRTIGRVHLTDTGLWFGEDRDHVSVKEVHEVIEWMIDEFGYKPKKVPAKKASKK